MVLNSKYCHFCLLPPWCKKIENLALFSLNTMVLNNILYLTPVVLTLRHYGISLIMNTSDYFGLFFYFF